MGELWVVFEVKLKSVSDVHRPEVLINKIYIHQHIQKGLL